MRDRLAEIQQALDAFRRDEARALVKQELEENPSAAAFYLAAQAARREGDRVDYLRKALELDPDYQLAADELAQIFPAAKHKREPVHVAAEAPIENSKPEQAVRPTEPFARAQPELRLASISRRWLAIVIDGFIVAVATVLFASGRRRNGAPGSGDGQRG